MCGGGLAFFSWCSPHGLETIESEGCSSGVKWLQDQMVDVGVGVDVGLRELSD
jgi:hypothetical protein